MANFSKYKKATISQKQTVPSKIYESLDRKSEAGPLRPTQDRILTEWYSNRRQDRDIIIKLPTGSGKTLIGLLIGLSYLNSNSGPVVYVCPNIYLMQQACADAEKFGICLSNVKVTFLLIERAFTKARLDKWINTVGGLKPNTPVINIPAI